MPEWTKYIRQNLHLHGLRPDREAEIIEDLAQQLEDAYREALAGGMAEADAAHLQGSTSRIGMPSTGSCSACRAAPSPPWRISRRPPIRPPAAAAGGRLSAAFSATCSSACA